MSYSGFSLVQEICEIPDIIRNLDISRITSFAQYVGPKVLLSGEGSSRIFPAKNTIYNAYKYGYNQSIFTEGATQSLEYLLEDFTVFIASNSGKTKEGVNLIRHLQSQKKRGHTIGISAQDNTPIIDTSDSSYVLSCGTEKATAATKSVIEQALFYDILFRYLNKKELPDLEILADKIDEAIKYIIPDDIVTLLSKTELLYWAGRNNGVAEELALKTNEIVRVKSNYLEGTYAVHGIEEVMYPSEVVIVIRPFESEESKYYDVLTKGVNIPIITLSSRKTCFTDIIIPTYEGFDSYIELCVGLSLLAQVGYKKGINIDTPERARKVGNEFIG